MRCVYTDREPVELPKYVYKSKNGFEIRKRIGNRVEYFGRFNDLETAIDELKDILELCFIFRDEIDVTDWEKVHAEYRGVE